MLNSSRNKFINHFFCTIYFVWCMWLQVQNTINIQFRQKVIVGRFITTLVIFLVIILILLTTTNIEKNDIIFLVIFLYLGIISALHESGLVSLCAFLMAYLVKNISINSILKTFILFSGLTLFIVIILNSIGVIPNALQYYGLNTNRVRSTLGFSYYSFASEMVFYLICAYIALRKKEISYSELILLSGINYYIFYFTNARNPFILSSLFIMISFVIKIFNFNGTISKNKVVRFLLEYCFPLGFVTVLIMTFLLPSNLFQNLNLILSNRLILNLNGFRNYGISLFGQKISFITMDTQGFVSSSYNYIDSAYLQALFLNGVLYLAIILVLSVILCKKIVKSQDLFFSIALVLMAIHAIFDPPLLWVWFSPFCLILGVVNKQQNILNIE